MVLILSSNYDYCCEASNVQLPLAGTARIGFDTALYLFGILFYEQI